MSEHRVRVRRERHFKPYNMLLSAAFCALEDAESRRPGCYWDELNAILLSALSIEAIGNSFGEELFDNWEDFESSKPFAKIRIIAERLEIDVDRNSDPWAAAHWLSKTRNKIVHPKPLLINEDKTMGEKKVHDYRLHPPRSPIEKEISLANAARACRSTQEILDQFVDALPEEAKFRFAGDGWSSEISAAEPKG